MSAQDQEIVLQTTTEGPIQTASEQAHQVTPPANSRPKFYQKLLRKRKWNRISLLIQFICGVVPTVIYTVIMDQWQRQNESQAGTHGDEIKNYVMRFIMIGCFVGNFARIVVDYFKPTLSRPRRLYRRFNRAMVMIMCCVLALNDRQLDKAFLTDNSQSEKVGFTKKHYRDVLIGVMAFEALAIAFCAFVTVEKTFNGDNPQEQKENFYKKHNLFG